MRTGRFFFGLLLLHWALRSVVKGGRHAQTSTKRAACAAVLLCLLGVNALAAAGSEWQVTSPNSSIKATLSLEKERGAKATSLSYSVEHRSQNSRTVVLERAPLGLHLSDANLGSGLKFVSATPVQRLAVSYSVLHGKRSQPRNEGNQVTFTFKNASGQTLEVDFAAFNDGIAFRYRVPAVRTQVAQMESELTGFRLPARARMWCAPADKPSTYAPAYETYYENETEAGSVASIGCGWSFPLLFRTEDARHWALITEANTGTNFCGTRLSNSATNRCYTVRLADPGEGNGTGSIYPRSRTPWEMPWRVVIIGDKPGAIVESTLVSDLAKPASQSAPAWVRPGRVAWSWWSDNPSPKDASKQKQWIDLAAQMGWEYVLVDANWTIMENGNIHDVLKYAKEKGVGVLLWYNSGGPHNAVTEKPRDCFAQGPVRQFELKMLRDWGVKGVKVDFFQSDKQNVIDLYHAILQDAATQQIMVNFHGCTLPRGWERTYPHLMSMEAVRGEECYIFDGKYPDAAPVQNTILPFTRNAVGPMDYTPVGLSNNRFPHKTSMAHELALAVLFETGWLHFTDKPEAYLSLPAEPKQFLKDVPVAWDDTRFVDGYPGKFVVIARQKGDTWYVAGVNGQGTALERGLRFGSWLKQGDYDAVLIGDEANGRGVESRRLRVGANHELSVKMAGFGGFAAVLKPAQ